MIGRGIIGRVRSWFTDVTFSEDFINILSWIGSAVAVAVWGLYVALCKLTVLLLVTPVKLVLPRIGSLTSTLLSRAYQALNASRNYVLFTLIVLTSAFLVAYLPLAQKRDSIATPLMFWPFDSLQSSVGHSQSAYSHGLENVAEKRLNKIDKRLSQAETTINDISGHISQLTISVTQSHADLRKAVEERIARQLAEASTLDTPVTKLELGHSDEDANANAFQSASLDSSVQKLLNDQSAKIVEVKSRLELLQKRLDKEVLVAASTDDRYETLAARLAVLSNSVGSVESKLNDSRSVELANRLLSTIIDSDELSNQLVNHLSANMRFELSSEIWSKLEATFARKGDRLGSYNSAEKTIYEKLTASVKDLEKRFESWKDTYKAIRDSPNSNPKAADKAFDIDGFLKEHQSSFSAMVREELEFHLKASKIMSRADIISLIDTKLQVAQNEIESKYDDIHKRLDVVEKMKAHNDGPLTRQITEELMQDVVSKALKKYRADIIATPDYALASAGAYVLDELTSPTYTMKISSTIIGALARLFDVARIQGNPPKFALSPFVFPGSCWGMSGIPIFKF